MTLRKNIKVVSWDLDGTLYSMKAMRHALNVIMLKHILRRPWTGFMDAWHLLRLQRGMKAARGDAARVEVYLRSEKGQRFMVLQADWISKALARVGGRKDCVDVLDRIRSLPVQQIVFSDYPTQKKLSTLKLEAYFAHHIVAADTYQVKPNRLVFERMCEELSVRPEQVLHIGDREDTDGGAADIGCHTLILGRDIDSLSDVLTWLGVGT